jgi:molecular chaperone GrpE (heat shock protein)
MERGLKDLKELPELMLARSALEQKNETIDAKDAVIRELIQKNRALERELDELKRAVPAAGNAGGHTGVESLIEDIVGLLVKCEKAPAAADLEGEIPAAAGLEEANLLSRKIPELLRDRWGLEIIDGEPAAIDPYIHRVVEVVKGPGNGERAVPLSRGYRLGKKILSPMKLRVFEGGKPQDGKNSRFGRGT